MATVAQYLTQLDKCRDDLANNLTTKGIKGVTTNDTLTTLVPKVLDIQTGGGGTGASTPKIEVYYGSSGLYYLNQEKVMGENKAKWCNTPADSVGQTTAAPYKNIYWPTIGQAFLAVWSEPGVTGTWSYRTISGNNVIYNYNDTGVDKWGRSYIRLGSTSVSQTSSNYIFGVMFTPTGKVTSIEQGFCFGRTE